jgi:hypothetical protein
VAHHHHQHLLAMAHLSIHIYTGNMFHLCWISCPWQFISILSFKKQQRETSPTYHSTPHRAQQSSIPVWRFQYHLLIYLMFNVISRFYRFAADCGCHRWCVGSTLEIFSRLGGCLNDLKYIPSFALSLGLYITHGSAFYNSAPVYLAASPKPCLAK